LKISDHRDWDEIGEDMKADLSVRRAIVWRKRNKISQLVFWGKPIPDELKGFNAKVELSKITTREWLLKFPKHYLWGENYRSMDMTLNTFDSYTEVLRDMKPTIWRSVLNRQKQKIDMFLK
jgi:hypothetical protein